MSQPEATLTTATLTTPAPEPEAATEAAAEATAAATEAATEAIQTGINLAQEAQEAARRELASQADLRSELSSLGQQVSSLSQQVSSLGESVVQLRADLETELEPESLENEVTTSAELVEMETAPQAAELPAPKSAPGKARGWFAKMLLNK